jgi:hypothetical protein
LTGAGINALRRGVHRDEMCAKHRRNIAETHRSRRGRLGGCEGYCANQTAVGSCRETGAYPGSPFGGRLSPLRFTLHKVAPKICRSS